MKVPATIIRRMLANTPRTHRLRRRAVLPVHRRTLGHHPLPSLHRLFNGDGPWIPTTLAPQPPQRRQLTTKINKYLNSYLLGASFGGGLCAYYAARRPTEISRLVLLNPSFDYKKRTIDNTPFWCADRLLPEGTDHLNTHGYLRFSNDSDTAGPSSTRCSGSAWTRSSAISTHPPCLSTDSRHPGAHRCHPRQPAPLHRPPPTPGDRRRPARVRRPRRPAVPPSQSQRWQAQVIAESCGWFTDPDRRHLVTPAVSHLDFS